MRFGDDVVFDVPGHGGAATVQDGAVYLAMALRNGGTGLAVLHGWRARAQPPRRALSGPLLLGQDSDLDQAPVQQKPDINEFRRQQLDLYVPAGDSGFWQGAMRDPGEPGYQEVRDAVTEDRNLWVDLIYGDADGGQRTIVRMLLGGWPGVEGRRASVLRYWNVDRDDPR